MTGKRLEDSGIQRKTRIMWVDIAKFICISLVMISHMEYVPSYAEYIFKPIFLTGFFFMSGYTFHVKNNFGSFLKKRISTILIPTIIFSVIYTTDMGTLLKGGYSIQQWLGDLSVLLRQQRGQGDVLWFTYVLFLSEIPLYVMCKFLSRKKMFLVSAVLCEASILYTKFFMKTIPYWYMHIIFVCMFFSVCGYCLQNCEKFTECLKNQKNRWFLVFSYAVLVAISAVCFHETANINLYVLPDGIWYVLTFSGVAALISVSNMITPNQLVLFCGQNTFIFYLLHDRIRGMINLLFQKIGFLSFLSVNNLRRTLLCLLVYCFEIGLLCVCTLAVNRYCRCFFGKRSVKQIN